MFNNPFARNPIFGDNIKEDSPITNQTPKYTLNESINLVRETLRKIENSGLTLFIQLYVDITNYKDYMLLKDKLNKNIINILHNLGVDLTYPTTSVYIEKQ